MKRTVLILAAVAALLAGSCTKQGKTAGSVSFSLEEGAVTEILTKGSVSDYASLPRPADFSLTVKNSLGATIYDGLLGAWNADAPLAAGNYSAQVKYGDPSAEGPGKPCFEGSASFGVLGGQTTNVKVTVTLANCIVKIDCSEAFKNYFPERSFVITTPESAGGFTYGDKAIFVAYQWTVSGTLTTQSGASYSLPERSFKGDAAHCYTVKYDVSNVGGVTITISFNDKVQTVKLDDIELNS